MSVGIDKNIYGLSEGVFKACQFLDLKFPPELHSSQEHVPSDYFGDDFELDDSVKEKLRSARKWTEERFEKVYEDFSKAFADQKPLKQTKTDLNVYFCDYVLFAQKELGASAIDYFDFEFYNKPFAIRSNFRTARHHTPTRIICNEPFAMELLSDKSETNKLFADFLHREWIYTRNCTFEEFETFVGKHSHFFSKPVNGSLGKGGEIIIIDSSQKLNELFTRLKERNRILEEIVTQHEEIASFCPSVVNTIRVYSILDVHNFVHILATSGRFGRTGGFVDNFHGGGVAVVIDPKTGTIISDGINSVHERMQKHPDSGKTFKGFQYPCWDKVRATVTKMAKMIPQLRHVGWDIAVTEKGEAVLIEANGKAPDLGLQQAPDDTGRLYLYQPLLEELKNYKREQMKLLGWRVNNLKNFRPACYDVIPEKNIRLPLAMSKLVPDCTSLMDVGCRKDKFLKTATPPTQRIIQSTSRRTTKKSLPVTLTKIFPILKLIPVSAPIPPNS